MPVKTCIQKPAPRSWCDEFQLRLGLSWLLSPYDQPALASARSRTLAWTESSTESRMNVLALKISMPINSPLALSSAVIFGLISTLPDSGSSVMARWRTSSFSKYAMRALLILEPPWSQSRIDLLTTCRVNRYGRECVTPLLSKIDVSLDSIFKKAFCGEATSSLPPLKEGDRGGF